MSARKGRALKDNTNNSVVPASSSDSSKRSSNRGDSGRAFTTRDGSGSATPHRDAIARRDVTAVTKGRHANPAQHEGETQDGDDSDIDPDYQDASATRHSDNPNFSSDEEDESPPPPPKNPKKRRASSAADRSSAPPKKSSRSREDQINKHRGRKDDANLSSDDNTADPSVDLPSLPPRKSSLTKSIYDVGKLFARKHCMTVDFAELVTFALRFFADAAEDPSLKEPYQGSSESEKLWDQWQRLTEDYVPPNPREQLPTIVATYSVESVVKELERGSAAARTEGAHAFKQIGGVLLNSYLDATPVDLTNHKHRGWEHPIAQILLCPLDEAHNPDDAECRKEFTQADAAEVMFDALPAYLFIADDEIPEKKRMPKPSYSSVDRASLLSETQLWIPGLFQSDVMVQFMRGATMSLKCVEERSNGRAARGFEDGVTFGIIAWTATMARFSLSDDDRFEFEKSANSSFNYVGFYNMLNELLNHPMNRKDATALKNCLDEELGLGDTRGKKRGYGLGSKLIARLDRAYAKAVPSDS